MKLLSRAAFTLIVMALAACSAVELRPDGSFVQIVKEAPESCQFMGHVAGTQSNALTDPFTRNVDLVLGARNAMVNQAASKGADTIVLLGTPAGQTKHGQTKQRAADVPKTPGVVYWGDAYDCDARRLAIR